MLFCMTVFGTLPLFVKNISLTSAQISFYRSVIATAVILIYLLLKGERIRFHDVKKDLLPLAFSGVAIGFNWVLLFEAYKYTTVASATLAYYFSPIIVLLISILFLREKCEIKDIFCFIFSIIGMVLITGVEGANSVPDHTKGVFLGLCAALLYALVVITNKRIKNVSGVHRTLFQFLVCIPVLFVYLLLSGEGLAVPVGTKETACLLTLGVLHTGIAYCLYFSSVVRLPAHTTAFYSYIDPLVCLIVSTVFLSETMTFLQVVGAVLILGSTLVGETYSLWRKKT